MKIAVASSGLGHVFRGVEAWAADLGKALAERGQDVILCKGSGEPAAEYERVVPCWPRTSEKTRRLRQFLPHSLGWRIGLATGYSVEQATYAWNLLRLLRKEHVDIVHVQDPQVALLVQHAWRLGLVRARPILAHGTEEPVDFQRRIMYLQHLAPWHLEETRAAGVCRSSWTAIPNFIDTEYFRPARPDANGREDGGLRRELQIPDDAVVVLIAAAIKRQHKRIDYVLSEFHKLLESRPGVPVYFILAGGRSEDTDELMEEGHRLLGEKVRFLVQFPRPRMADLYRSADLFLLGSLKEMMPIALLEATATGLPCLVNSHPVMEWMVGPGGLAIDMAAPGALSAALRDLSADKSNRQALGRLARQHCVSNFSRDRVVDQILEYYQEVVGQRPALRETGT